jgi:hypothetical protein
VRRFGQDPSRGLPDDVFRHEWEGELFNRAYDRALVALQRNAIDRTSFSDLYHDDVIARDSQEVARLEQVFAANATPESERLQRAATIFHGVVHDQGSRWFGERASFIKTDPFDDYKGVDEVMRVREPHSHSHLALSVDVTYSSQHVSEKLNGILQQVRRGQLGQVKYFRAGDYRGELSNVPRVVLGADSTAVDQLTRLWAKGDEEGLVRHPVRWLLFEELYLQLNGIARYAKRIGKPNVAAKYEAALAVVRSLHDEARRSPQGLKPGADSAHDRVYQASRRQLVELHAEN